MMEIHQYKIDSGTERLEVIFKDDMQAKIWVDYLNNVFPENAYFKNAYWWCVRIIEVRET